MSGRAEEHAPPGGGGPRAGSADDEAALCARFRGRLVAYGLRHLGNRTAAEDLAHEVLVTVLDALRAGRVEDTSRIDAFVLGTCRHMTWDANRGARRQSVAVERLGAGAPEFADPAVPEVDRHKLEACLRLLPPRELQVVLATFGDDHSSDEIAAHLALTAGNVRVIRHRALATLHACVERGGAS